MTRNFILCMTAAVVMTSYPATVRAEGMADQAYTSVLLDLNRIRPDQNPALILGKAQLNARIVDKNQRTIGKVDDIIVSPNGSFETILTKIDTTGFREDVAIDVASFTVEPKPDTFTVNLNKEQLKQNLPQLMAATATASGGPQGPFTLKTLQNGEIYKPDGTPVAKVKDVLIDNRAAQVVSLFVTMSSGANRGASLAVPYEAANARLQGSKAILTVTDAQAGVMSSVAKR